MASFKELQLHNDKYAQKENAVIDYHEFWKDYNNITKKAIDNGITENDLEKLRVCDNVISGYYKAKNNFSISSTDLNTMLNEIKKHCYNCDPIYFTETSKKDDTDFIKNITEDLKELIESRKKNERSGSVPKYDNKLPNNWVEHNHGIRGGKKKMKTRRNKIKGRKSRKSKFSKNTRKRINKKKT